jgi:drug/metabolite transporter (DMT)-like permease
MLKGIAFGLAAALGWAIYNVGVEIGRRQGFSSADLTLLRYIVPGIVLLPLLIARRRQVAARLGFARAAALTVAIGPLFAFVFNTGYGIAPLAHAVVISPGMTMITANALSVLVDRRPLPLHRQIGILILMGGLAAIAIDQPAPKDPTTATWLGDLCFVCSGFLWGLFTYLLGRWRLDPIDTTAAVGLLATISFLPVYLVWFGVSDLPLHDWALQVVYQGGLGGCLAIIFYAAAIATIGPGLGGLFPALVPPLAVLLAIPLAGNLPSAAQWVGIALATLGLLTSLDLARRLLGRREKPR